MKEDLAIAGFAGVFFLAILSAVGIIAGGSIDLGAERVYELGNIAVATGLLTLAAAAFMGDRSYDELELWEMGAIAVAAGVLLAVYADVAALTDLLDQYHPWTGVAAATPSFVGYHRLAWG